MKHQRADKLFIPAVQGEVACQRTKLLQQAGSTHAPAVRVCKRVCICVYVCTRACACVCALIAACTGVACTGVHAHAPDNASHCHSNACCLLGCHGLMEQHHTTRQDDERFNMADHIIRQGAVCGGGSEIRQACRGKWKRRRKRCVDLLIRQGVEVCVSLMYSAPTYMGL